MAKTVYTFASPDSIRWSRNQFHRAIGPMVYIWWGCDSDYCRVALYVGKSKHGLSRPLGPSHHRASLYRKITDVEFIPCESDAEAIALETKIIRKLNPSYNDVRITGGGRIPYKPKDFR